MINLNLNNTCESSYSKYLQIEDIFKKINICKTLFILNNKTSESEITDLFTLLNNDDYICTTNILDTNKKFYIISVSDNNNFINMLTNKIINNEELRILSNNLDLIIYYDCVTYYKSQDFLNLFSSYFTNYKYSYVLI